MLPGAARACWRTKPSDDLARIFIGRCERVFGRSRWDEPAKLDTNHHVRRWPTGHLDVAYLAAWIAVDEHTVVLIEMFDDVDAVLEIALGAAGWGGLGSPQRITSPSPSPRSLAPRMRRTIIMITALWADRNCLTVDRKLEALRASMRKYSTGPTTVMELMAT